MKMIPVVDAMTIGDHDGVVLALNLLNRMILSIIGNILAIFNEDNLLVFSFLNFDHMMVTQFDELLFGYVDKKIEDEDANNS